MDDKADTSQPEPDKQPIRKPRRWRRRLIGTLVFLLILVGILPYLASTPPGTALVVSIADGFVPGKLAIEDLSLGWFGRCVVAGAELHDKQQRELVHVHRLTYSPGLLGAIWSWKQLGEITIDRSRIHIYQDQKGAKAAHAHDEAKHRPVKVAAQEQPSPLPALHGRITLKDGALTITGADGRKLELSRIDGHVALATFNTVEMDVSLQTAQGGRLTAQAKLQNLAPQGPLAVAGATGTVRVTTPAELPVAELAAFGLGEVKANGKIKLEVNAQSEKGTLQADIKAGATGLAVQYAEGGRIEPIDLQLAAAVQSNADAAAMRMALEGPPANVKLEMKYPYTGQPANAEIGSAISAILTGKAGALPLFSLDGQGQADLVKLARAVPVLLAVRPGVEVTGGTINLTGLAMRGGNQPSVAGTVSIMNLTAINNGKPVQCEPITLNLDALVEPNQGLSVRKGELQAGFARLTAAGTAADLKLDLQADLALLQQQIGQVFDFGSTELAGRITGTGGVKRSGENQFELSAAVQAESLACRQSERKLEIAKARASQTGTLELAGESVSEIKVSSVEADLDGKIVVTGTGQLRPRQRSCAAHLESSQLDLAYLTALLKNLGVADIANCTGNGQLKVDVHRADAAGPMVVDGGITLRGATLAGKPVSSEDVSLAWSAMSVGPKDGAFKLKTAQLISTPARLTVEGVDCRFGKDLTATGSVQGSADLAQLMDVISRAQGRDQPPALAGALKLRANCATSAQHVKLSSESTIDGLQIGTGDKTIREKQVRLTANAALNREKNALQLETLQLESQLATVRLSGEVAELSTARRLAIKGDYQAAWEAVTSLIHELSPETKETLAFTGKAGSPIEAIGPVNVPDAQPPFRELTSGLSIGWATAHVYGLRMGQAALTPALRNGVLNVPFAEIPAVGGGKVRLGATVDFQREDATLLIPEKVHVMEDIPVTPELGKYLLSRVNPIFGQMTKSEGFASLILQGIDVPLSEKIKQRGVGQGRLDLRDLKIAPGGMMADLIQLGGLGKEEMYTIQVEGVDFTLKDGRLAYQNFGLIFVGDFDVRFRGSIGLDDTVDLVMSIPLRPSFLERVGIRGRSADYARLFAGARIDVPITGTRLLPKIDLNRVDLKPIEKSLKDSAAGAVGDLLKNLGGGSEKKK